jgi:hypothetical protein
VKESFLLVGASLWAAQRLSEQNDSDFCFPRYTNKQRCNSNSASAAINKWVKSIAGEDTVIHGLRHSFRDRLRAAEAPTELIDQLGWLELEDRWAVLWERIRARKSYKLDQQTSVRVETGGTLKTLDLCNRHHKNLARESTLDTTDPILLARAGSTRLST